MLFSLPEYEEMRPVALQRFRPDYPESDLLDHLQICFLIEMAPVHLSSSTELVVIGTDVVTPARADQQKSIRLQEFPERG